MCVRSRKMQDMGMENGCFTLPFHNVQLLISHTAIWLQFLNRLNHFVTNTIKVFLLTSHPVSVCVCVWGGGLVCACAYMSLCVRGEGSMFIFTFLLQT